MSLGSTIKFLLQHPLAQKQPLPALWRFGSWQLRSRISTNPVVVNWIEGTRFWMGKGWTGVTGNYYTGLHEFQDMAFLLHLLRPGDHFADVGANMGSYTVLASGVCKAHTYCFEPVPFTFGRLLENIKLNNIQHLTTSIQAAVGSEAGEILFTDQEDTTNHVATASEQNTISIPMVKLDDAITQHVTLLKIDVEGFETAALAGAEQLLKNDALKAIIIELNGSGERYGYTDESIHKKLIELGFVPHGYNAFKRQLLGLQTYGDHNTIYIRDVDWVIKRLRDSPRMNILNQEL